MMRIGTVKLEVESTDGEDEGEISESGDSNIDDETQLDSNVMSSSLAGSCPMMVSPVSSAQPPNFVPPNKKVWY